MIKVLKRIVYILFILSIILLTGMIISFNVLPDSYLTKIILFVIGLLMFMTFINIKTKKKIISVILILIELLGIGIMSFSSYTVYKTDSFIGDIPTIEEETIEYYVVVLNDSNYENIEDLKDKRVSTYSINDENYSQALDSLKSKVNIEVDDSDDLFKSSSDLLNGEIDAMFMSSFYKTVLDEEIENYKDSTKIIATITATIPKKEEKKDVKINKDVYTIYISGIDTSGPIKKVSRSDVNIVITINTKTNEILLTSIPRDYYVQLHGTTGRKDKLTHSGIYGIDMSITTIEDLLDVDIDYYLRVNFDTLVKVVDAVGGIDVYSDVQVKVGSVLVAKKGWNSFNGKETLRYVRQRKVFASGDRKRGEHQEDVITAIINKVTSSKVLLNNYFEILDSLKDSFQTSIPEPLIKYFIKQQIEKMPTWTIKRINLDGDGKMDYTYSIPNAKAYVMVPDETTIQKVKKTIKGMIDGKTFKELEIE